MPRPKGDKERSRFQGRVFEGGMDINFFINHYYLQLAIIVPVAIATNVH
jgi:hypothetical protein